MRAETGVLLVMRLDAENKLRSQLERMVRREGRLVDVPWAIAPMGRLRWKGGSILDGKSS